MSGLRPQDIDPDGRPAVSVVKRAALFMGCLNFGDIAQIYGRAIALPNDDIPELVAEIALALDFYQQLVSFPVKPAGGNISVPGGYGLGHLPYGEIQIRQPVGINGKPDFRLVAAEHLHVGNFIHP